MWLLLAVRHALEGNHLATVASLATRKSGARHNLGSARGTGHTLTILHSARSYGGHGTLAAVVLLALGGTGSVGLAISYIAFFGLGSILGMAACPH